MTDLIEGADYFVCVWSFPNCASDMFVVENDDGTYTINLNSRFTFAQLIQNAPHELVHIIENHFQSERHTVELEKEAETKKTAPALQAPERRGQNRSLPHESISALLY